MKRAGNLFEQIVDRDNLRHATARALRGKRGRPEARAFVADLDRNLKDMAEQLRARTYPVGRFRQFVIHDPKERVITAPVFPERVLHHAVVGVCEPVFERWLIADTFACRKGKGRDAALARAQQFAGRFRWFLKLDVRKYYDSVRHDLLLGRLEGRFKDRALLDLFERIVRSFRAALGRGLPIGSLTSQHFANFFLGGLDRLLKEAVRVPGYVRYMDDMALWSDDRRLLRRALAVGEDFVRDELGLEFKPIPFLNRTDRGMDFLGCRVYRRHRVLNRRSRVRYRRRLARLEGLAAIGQLSEEGLQRRATALTAFARAAGVSSWRWRRRALEALAVEGQRPRTG